MNPYSIVKMERKDGLLSILVKGPDGEFWIHAPVEEVDEALAPVPVLAEGERVVDHAVELKKKADELLGQTSAFDKIVHLFSKDEGLKIAARLHQLAGEIRLHLRFAGAKSWIVADDKPIKPARRPTLVRVRPCGEKYKGRTFLGILLGDAALSFSLGIEDAAIKISRSFYNPAIYVCETGDVVYGVESWWGEIEKMEDLADITDATIGDVWYVKLAHEMFARNKADEEVSSVKEDPPVV